MYRFGLFLTVTLFALVSLAEAAQEKGAPPGKKDKEAPPKKPEKLAPPLKEKPLPPTTVIAAVELKDGSSFMAEFRLAEALVIRTEDLGPVVLKLDRVRFVDLEGNTHRIATHALENFYGFVQTEELPVKMLATDRIFSLTRSGLKRIVFPDPPREFAFP